MAEKIRRTSEKIFVGDKFMSRLEDLIKNYNAKNFHAAFEIGKIYQEENNFEAAIDWFKKFIHSANISQVELGDSLTQIGEIYFYGQGTEQNYPKAARYFLKAVKHYDKAASENDGRAYYYLGTIYYFGYCGEVNIVQAVKYLKKSVTLGNEFAMHRLAGIYLDEKISSVSEKEIVELLERTADWDILGMMYINGKFGYNPIKAAKYFQKAADKGDVESAWQLAELFEQNKFLSAHQSDNLYGGN